MRIMPIVVVAALPLIFFLEIVSADFTKGQDAYNSGDYQTAISEWQPLADEGNAEGQFGMGLIYGNGFGADLNDDLALKWYGAAAEQGHADAQCNLAVMHANGWGVPQSDKAAFDWYSLAAEQGVTEAQIAVAKMYSSGFGAQQNNVMAHKWFAIASAMGDYDANFKRDMLSERMSPEEIADSGALAAAWMENHQSLLAKD